MRCDLPIAVFFSFIYLGRDVGGIPPSPFYVPPFVTHWALLFYLFIWEGCGRVWVRSPMRDSVRPRFLSVWRASCLLSFLHFRHAVWPARSIFNFILYIYTSSNLCFAMAQI
ncbi:hypothetical protein C8J57DRAFT_1304632 [Mycena rebaudengoi]|nr:hypothetical protein C8J57DRAFT_1304632 [Mycena rebaudengoi]